MTECHSLLPPCEELPLFFYFLAKSCAFFFFFLSHCAHRRCRTKGQTLLNAMASISVFTFVVV